MLMKQSRLSYIDYSNALVNKPNILRGEIVICTCLMFTPFPKLDQQLTVQLRAPSYGKTREFVRHEPHSALCVLSLLNKYI